MKRRPLFLILVAIFLITCFAQCVEKNRKEINGITVKKEQLKVKFGNKSKELVFEFNEIPPESVKRKWKKIEYRKEFQIGGIEKSILLYPSKLRVDKNNNIYILDNKDYSVKKFDKYGNFQKKFGKKGKGPGEFETPFDFDIYGEDKVAILSPNDNKFGVFYKNKIYEHKFKLMPIKLAFIDTYNIIAFQIMDPITFSPFQMINYKTGKVIECKNFLNKNTFSGESTGMLPFLLGDVFRYDKRGFVYISAIMGYVLIYNNKCEISGQFKLIDNIKDSGLVQRKQKLAGMDFPIVRFPRLREYLFLSSNVFGDKLFINNNQVKKDSNDIVIDIYSLSELRYLYSVLLKNIGNIVNIYFTDNKLYIIKKDTSVLIYEYKVI